MVFCISCGKENPTGATFCYKCGTRIVPRREKTIRELSKVHSADLTIDTEIPYQIKNREVVTIYEALIHLLDKGTVYRDGYGVWVFDKQIMGALKQVISETAFQEYADKGMSEDELCKVLLIQKMISVETRKKGGLNLDEINIETEIVLEGTQTTFKDAIEQGLKEGSIIDHGTRYEFEQKYFDAMDHLTKDTFSLRKGPHQGVLSSLMSEYEFYRINKGY